MWLLVILVYFAPPDAVDWQGSYELGISRIHQENFTTEKSCQDKGEAIKTVFNEGALAPFRYRCLEVPSQINQLPNN